MQSKVFCVLTLAAGAFSLAGCSGNNGGASGARFTQQERLARPIVNEALATFANNRHSINNRNTPQQDGNEAGDPASGALAADIEAFLTHPQHTRSPQIRGVIRSVLVPDVMIADLSQNATTADYLGVETNGATGSRFGGRGLEDDVVDTSLSIVFGTTVSDLGLAPADGNQIPTLTSDNVGPSANKLAPFAFPYLANPR
jgi:hypothetical protein